MSAVVPRKCAFHLWLKQAREPPDRRGVKHSEAVERSSGSTVFFPWGLTSCPIPRVRLASAGWSPASASGPDTRSRSALRASWVRAIHRVAIPSRSMTSKLNPGLISGCTTAEERALRHGARARRHLTSLRCRNLHLVAFVLLHAAGPYAVDALNKICGLEVYSSPARPHAAMRSAVGTGLNLEFVRGDDRSSACCNPAAASAPTRCRLSRDRHLPERRATCRPGTASPFERLSRERKPPSLQTSGEPARPWPPNAG